MARLRRADCSGPGITRRARGKRLRLLRRRRASASTSAKCSSASASSGIPPAWKDVWICPYPNGHLQATGVDAAGRKQYRYHEDWRTRRDAEKFDEMTRFAKALPRLREQVEADLRRFGPAHPRARAGLRRAAARPRLLPHRHRGVHGHQRVVRPGDDPQGARADRRRARWSSTTRPRAASGASRRSSTRWRRTSCARSSAAAAAATSCWPTRTGARWYDLRSDDINDYLKAVTGDDFSAKDFRTWSATVIAALALAVSGPAQGSQDLTQPRDHARDQGDLALPRQHARRSAARPTSTRASSTPTAAGSCSTSR